MSRPRIVIGNPYPRQDRGGTYYFTLFGRPVSLETKDKEDAENKWLIEYWTPYKEGKIKDPQGAPSLLYDCMNDIIRQKEGLNKGKRTVDDYRCILPQFVRFVGNKSFRDITHIDLINYKIHMVNKKYSDFYINKQITYVNSFLNSMEWQGKTPPHKDKRLKGEWKKSKYRQRDVEMPDEREKECWLDWSRHVPEEFRDIMAIEYFCGITARDFMEPIFFGENEIKLWRMKTETKMFIPFFKELKKYIPHLVGAGWKRLWKYSIWDFNHKHQKIRQGIGLDRMTPHYFKHVFVSIMMGPQVGATERQISRFTGTTIATIRKVYEHTIEGNEQELADKFSEVVA